MGEKDITEKVLLSYNDVFADLMNVLLFDGRNVVDPDELEDQLPRSHYKADGKIRELERDVVKRWKKNNIRIACIGIENQTEPDKYTVLRVAGYDGAEYRAQMINLEKGMEPYPVITMVLYFGYKKHWDQPTSLYDALNVPDDLKPFVNDIKINLFEIAYLSREQVNMFQSDFKVVADYFVQMAENGDYIASADELNHVQEVLQLLNVMEKDHRFEKYLNEKEPEKEVQTMSDWLTKVINEADAKGKAEGEAKGKAEGEAKGKAEGENKMAALMKKLLSEGRIEDAEKATEDVEFRNSLFQEYQIA